MRVAAGRRPTGGQRAPPPAVRFGELGGEAAGIDDKLHAFLFTKCKLISSGGAGEAICWLFNTYVRLQGPVRGNALH